MFGNQIRISLKFPQNEEFCEQRKFRQDWLIRYSWLISKYLDGAFCLPCCCFGVECGKNATKLDKLFISSLTSWTTACVKFERHASGKCETHNFPSAMQNFMDVMRRRATPIDQQMNQLVQRRINENHNRITKMKSLIKTVIFCGNNNIPLRGARDDGPNDPNLTRNFQALLEFRIDSGDEKLAEHFRNAPRNATYRSKTIQNEIIETVSSYITSKIAAEMKESKLFAVLTDEAADVSNKEHLSLVLRYVDSSRTIREEFVGFRLCEGDLSGEAIKRIILETIAEMELSKDNCRGQSYDGAGNMAGISTSGRQP